MTDDRPGWARRMTREREARNWSQAEAVRAMRAHSRDPLPEDSSLLRQWKRWETGEHVPSDFYQPLIAVTFGTVTHALFPVEGRRDANAELLSATGMDTLELVHRLQTSDADDSTIDSLRIVTDRLCSEYPYLPSDQLLVEGRGLAPATDDLPRTATDSGAAPGDPRARRLACPADRLRRVRHRTAPRCRDDPPGCAVPWRRDRSRRDQCVGARDARLDGPDHRRLPRRHRGRPQWSRSRTESGSSRPARGAGSQSLGAHRRQAPDRGVSGPGPPTSRQHAVPGESRSSLCR